MALLKVELQDVIKNYNLSEEQGFLFCLFEAVSNSLYCCLENQKIEIEIKFYREYAPNNLIGEGDNLIRSFEITDNGTGFTDDNYAKFTETMYKTNHEGGKGLRRMAFLKVFQAVEIESVFLEKGKNLYRNFIFGSQEITNNRRPAEKDSKRRTTLTFRNIDAEYQKYAKKDITEYSGEILRHFYIFLYYLIENNKKFCIRLVDDHGTGEGIIDNAKLSKDIVQKEKFSLENDNALSGMNKAEFEIVHIKTTNLKENGASYVVDERSAGKLGIDLPPYILEDSVGRQYYYHLYLKSDYFKQFLNESRTELKLPTEKKNLGFSITEELIVKSVEEKIKRFLSYEIAILDEKKEQKVIETLMNPENNRIISNNSYLYLISDRNTKDAFLKELKYNEITPQKILNKIKSFHEELQNETVNKINKTISELRKVKAETDIDRLEGELKELMSRVNIENVVNLSSYIMYRKYILNLFNEGLEFCKKSKSHHEAFFHDLFLPRKTTNSIDSNLWLLDDMYLYFEGTSEISLDKIEINGERIIRELSDEEEIRLREFNQDRLRKRIDLLFFPEEKKCIIIELKDPKAKVDENVLQMDRYAQLIANFVKPEYGIEQFYTYLITDNFNKYDKPGNGYRKIYGMDGFVRSSAEVKSFEDDHPIADQYSEVIRYTDIYGRARKRNEVFFTKLGVSGK
ncbi:MAG: hypothetical protein LBQ96_01960 [Fusobacteriaceae bacterium]|jgi:hypothetical protein|nr:hypothetical protein [Fusobacteriaceae bacterium]